MSTSLIDSGGNYNPSAAPVGQIPETPRRTIILTGLAAGVATVITTVATNFRKAYFYGVRDNNAGGTPVMNTSPALLGEVSSGGTLTSVDTIPNQLGGWLSVPDGPEAKVFDLSKFKVTAGTDGDGCVIKFE